MSDEAPGIDSLFRDGKPFWGLVEQKGPWKSTPADRARSGMKDKLNVGGGVGAGGRVHAGHGNYSATMTPYQINATGAPPKPSAYAMRSVLIDGGVDMKRQTKFGRVKTGLTLAGRTPMQTNQKAGMSTTAENIDGDEAGGGQGVRLGAVPGGLMPNLLLDSSIPDLMRESITTTSESLPPITTSAPFITEHRVAEFMDEIRDELTNPFSDIYANNFQSDTAEEIVGQNADLFASLRNQMSAAAASGRMSVDSDERIPLPPSFAGYRQHSVVSPTTTRSSYASTSRGSIASRQMSVDSNNIMHMGMVPHTEPALQPYVPPRPHLSISGPTQALIEREEENRNARKKVMDGLQLNIPQAHSVHTEDRKKKVRLTKKPAPPKTIAPTLKSTSPKVEKAERVEKADLKTVNLGKKTAPVVGKKQQPVTAKNVAALRKRLGDSKVYTMFRAMKKNDIRYNIFEKAVSDSKKKK